ncbi:MAG: hypothetical protein K9M75_08540 [Phycisphaerae bacterium]|nr:hypothetical protein [Phycisphaerae bacterium]
MLNRRLFCKIIFVIAAVSAIAFSGCDETKNKSQRATFNESPQTNKFVEDKKQLEAVKLYVDAMMLKDIEKWQEAINKLNTAVEYAPKFSLAYSFKGDIYQLTRQYVIAADSYEQATIIDPWSFKDFSCLGKVCQIIEDYPRAVTAYVSACELNPNDYGVFLGAGRCYYELNEYDLSFGYCRRAKDINSNIGDADVLLGDLYSVKKNLGEAIASYKRALEIDGNKPEIMISLAVAYTNQVANKVTQEDKTANYTVAEELLTSAIEKDSNNNTAYQYLGYVQLHLHNDNLDLALNSYEKAVAIDDKDWMARKGLGVVYMLKYMKLKNEAQEQGTLDQLDTTFKLKALENWKVSMSVKPDQDDLMTLYTQYASK